MKQLLDIIKHKDSDYDDEKLCEMFSEMAHKIKETNGEYFKDIKHRLEKMAYGLTAEDAKKSVSAMVRKDGGTGEKYSMEEAKRLAFENRVEETATEMKKHFCENEWYWSLNMAYADYFMLEKGDDYYTTIAKDFMLDKDGGNYKVGKYITYISDGE